MKKLVRDKIPHRAQGGRLVFRKAKPEERLPLLRSKLIEEVGEYLSEPSLDELADVLSVIWELAIEAHSTDLDGLRWRAQQKAAERGGFSGGSVMEWQPSASFAPRQPAVPDTRKEPS